MENVLRSVRDSLRRHKRIFLGTVLAVLLATSFWLLEDQSPTVFLGFKGGQPFQKAEERAAALGFRRVGDCRYRQYAGRPPITDYTDCKFWKADGEAMEMSFYHGQLQRISYDFATSRYGEFLEAIRKDNGDSRSPIGADFLVWGTSKLGTISLGKTATGTRGFVSVVFDIPELDQDIEDLRAQIEKRSESAGSLEMSEDSHSDDSELKSLEPSQVGELGYALASRRCKNHVLEDESGPKYRTVRFVDVSTDTYYQYTRVVWLSYDVVIPAMSYTRFMRANCLFDASDQLHAFSRFQRDPASGRAVGGAMLDLPNGAVSH